MPDITQRSQEWDQVMSDTIGFKVLPLTGGATYITKRSEVLNWNETSTLVTSMKAKII